MKQELPFAVALLACGCLLWLYESGSSISKPGSENLARLGPGSLTKIETDAGEFERQHFDDSDQAPIEGRFIQQHVALAGYQEVEQSGTLTKHPPGGLQSGKNRFVHQTSDPETIKLLASISQELSESKPFSSTIRLTGNMFGHVVSATGNYYQMGQGTNKSRLELSFGSEPNAPSVFQLCDGRFVYKLRTEGPSQSLEFVDLIRVSEKAGEPEHGMTPTGWVATGGIASLFQHLASAFNFGAIEKINETSVVMRGSWDENALRRIIRTTKGAPQPGATLWWDDVPAQLPHAVELVFEKTPGLQYAPGKISFLKFSTKVGRTQMKPTVTLEFSSPQPLGAVGDRFFVIDSSNLESIDATDRYIARIASFGQTLHAAEKSEPLERPTER